MVDLSGVYIQESIQAAKNGNRTAAKKILGWAYKYLQTNEPLPEELRDYLLEAFDAILSRKISADKALYFKRSKSAQRLDMSDQEREIEITRAVQEGVDMGKSITQSITFVVEQNKFGIDYERVKKIHTKWRENIEVTHEFLHETVNG